jgi:hypothetical protein
METPNNKSGATTEAIMAIFWQGKLKTKLPTEDYNAVYSHVYDTLSKGNCK